MAHNHHHNCPKCDGTTYLWGRCDIDDGGDYCTADDCVIIGHCNCNCHSGRECSCGYSWPRIVAQRDLSLCPPDIIRTAPSMNNCECPDFWFELTGNSGLCYFSECPAYESCGGWSWDPPCGGCDSCMWAQTSYYDEDDGYWKWVCSRMHFWSKLQAACA